MTSIIRKNEPAGSTRDTSQPQVRATAGMKEVATPVGSSATQSVVGMNPGNIALMGGGLARCPEVCHIKLLAKMPKEFESLETKLAAK